MRTPTAKKYVMVKVKPMLDKQLSKSVMRTLQRVCSVKYKMTLKALKYKWKTSSLGWGIG